MSHVLSWLQEKLGNVPSRWPWAWQSIGAPITMEEKENGGWDNQLHLSTSIGLTVPGKNWQEIYKAMKKKSLEEGEGGE